MYFCSYGVNFVVKSAVQPTETHCRPCSDGSSSYCKALHSFSKRLTWRLWPPRHKRFCTWMCHRMQKSIKVKGQRHSLQLHKTHTSRPNHECLCGDLLQMQCVQLQRITGPDGPAMNNATPAERHSTIRSHQKKKKSAKWKTSIWTINVTHVLYDKNVRQILYRRFNVRLMREFFKIPNKHIFL